jgi:hypothetical protein
MAEGTEQAAPTGDVSRKLARLLESVAKNKPSLQHLKPAEPASSAPSPCRPPALKKQHKFLTPTEETVKPLDYLLHMDIACYKITKKKTLPNEVISYDLPDGKVEIASSAYGMASSWDYDLVIMAVSHIAAQMKHYQAGRGPKPGPYFRPRLSQVLKYCERGKGGKQRKQLSDALDRLSTTYVRIERARHVRGEYLEFKSGECLIAGYDLVVNPKTNAIEFIEIQIAGSTYREIAKGKGFKALLLHPDYFKISSGVGRVVYRLARQAAGKSTATWGFKTLYQRSCSTGTLNEFCRLLRDLIRENDLPEYKLVKVHGKMGEMLTMTYRGFALEEMGYPGEKSHDA